MRAVLAERNSTLCLGEAMVDLICERAGVPFAGADRFSPHPGGVTANTAVFAARAGAAVAIAGAVGGDSWGRWLRRRLAAEGVDVSLLRLREREATQLALVALDAGGEPSYRLYPGAAAPLSGIEPRVLDDALARSVALLITSNTLSEPAERSLTLHARACALECGARVVLDCNLRLHRWPSERDAVAAVLECVPGAALVRANAAEATALTAERDPGRAARRLLELGARLAVVTLGAAGVLLVGAGGALERAAAPPVQVRSVVGAGDAFTGTLLAAVAWDRADDLQARVRAALPEALRAAARACETWGAYD
ncbi:MAG TPA: PfkB family carbohydrate kinase [Solirubrobacteraceae bacterium]|nr:PfkB family carbohydrate kinase [Solirubrobacteraceae bacterium]